MLRECECERASELVALREVIIKTRVFVCVRVWESVVVLFDKTTHDHEDLKNRSFFYSRQVLRVSVSLSAVFDQ